MMNVRNIPFLLFFLLMISALFSCGETAPTGEIRLLDSLNRKGYDFRYKNLDSSYEASMQAYREAHLYSQGKAEACNNLAFCAFMQMNFDEAERLYREISGITSNELERLIADVGLMKIYQRTSMNKEYYDARNSALRRMKRINEEISVFVDAHELIRLNYAFSEFHIVSAIYYYYLQQRSEAIASIDQVKVDAALEADTAQLLYYTYIKASAYLSVAGSLQDRKISEFDHLFHCWRTSLPGGYLYFTANALQGISELLNDPATGELLYQRRLRALNILNPDGVPDSLLPLHLAETALEEFKKYEDMYQIAGTYRTIGTYYNTHGRFTDALSVLSQALGYVNGHHEQYYHCTDTTDRLKVFNSEDTVFKELTWMSQDDIKTVPEWVARIREQLSVTYAGLGEKARSDYNRNIYLDILEHTRQDKELESRYMALEKESRQLSILTGMVISGIVLLIILFGILNSRWKERNRRYIERLRLTLDVCQKITSSIPADAISIEEITSALTTSVSEDFKQLFGALFVSIRLAGEEASDSGYIFSEYDLLVPDKAYPVGVLRLCVPVKPNPDDEALINVITPYIAWTLDNGLMFISLGDARKQFEKQRYVYEQHIAANKRQNLIKKACLAIVAGITPYMDRAINEVGKVRKLMQNKDTVTQDSTVQLIKDKYQYIDELVTKINEYNDILALWIKMKQGSLNLNIENFALNDLFEVLAKGRKTFDMKHQHFSVEATEAVIKADKALTLFMINTLTENARKYTPEGGSIRIYARQESEYVEISVEDTGSGLNEEDVSCILGEKVYDSRRIGMQAADDVGELSRNKGSGFGLMNCKGIIEKYRKTSDVFRVCLFSIESVPGKGSRFFFRLPKGVRKTLMFLFLLAGVSLHATPDGPTPLNKDRTYEQLLREASLFADTAYYCNVDEDYALALQYADSAINRLNCHYERYASGPYTFIGLKGEGIPAEIHWWNNGFVSDYYVILDIRNEAAVAFLALKDLEGYAYNNEGYTSLFKLIGEDNSLEGFCRDLEHSSNNKAVGLTLCLLLLIALLAGYYILYFRRRLANRLNLEQVLEINKQVFAASSICPQEPDGSLSIPLRIVNETFEAVNELLIIDMMGIGVFDEETHKLNFMFNPGQPEEEETLISLMRECFARRVYTASPGGVHQCLPLLVDVGDGQRCVGVLAVLKRTGTELESNRLLFELITRYVAIVVFNGVVKLVDKYRDIEWAEDEVRRVSREDGLLHVQNMVLDNCLSTIKHETIYYPSKIKQIIDKLRTEIDPVRASAQMETISELIDYYKDIFTILSSCASRQLEEVVFRRGVVEADELVEYAARYLKKALKRSSCHLTLEVSFSGLVVIGDVVQLRFLFENLIDEAVSYPADGILRLDVMLDETFVRFNFTDTRREKPIDELNQLFYPDLTRMSVDDSGRLVGTEYLVCKQIIRDHDEFAGRRGCRVNAEPSPQGGFTVYFTLPLKDHLIVKYTNG